MKYYGLYVLSLNPMVLASIGKPASIPAWAKDCVILEHAAWYQGYWLKMIQQRRKQKQFSKDKIEHHLIVNTPKELSMAKRCGVRTAFASQQLYCSENVFQPTATAKDFDAVYIAKLEHFKRHELASAVKKLALVKTGSGDIKTFCPAISHAATNVSTISKTEVAVYINRSYCSLALSKEEGAMFASFESLLCGIPVISTPSRGGRDIFFDKTNSIIVEANPNAVARAVQEIKRHPLNSQEIRTKAIRDLAYHRGLYCQLLKDIISRRGGAVFNATHFLETRFKAIDVDTLFVESSETAIPNRISDYLLKVDGAQNERT